jgi:hypothetical protein
MTLEHSASARDRKTLIHSFNSTMKKHEKFAYPVHANFDHNPKHHLTLLSLYRIRLLIKLNKAETEIWFISEYDTFKRPINHDRQGRLIMLGYRNCLTRWIWLLMTCMVGSKPK